MLTMVCLGFPCVSFAEESDIPLRMTLAEALQKANTVNLQVMMANARVEQALARISLARADLLPHLEGTVSGARQTADLRAEGLMIPIPGFSAHVGPYNNFDARARVTMALFDPSAFERLQAARKGGALSQAQLAKTREDVLALVASLYVDAQRKAQSVGVIETLREKVQMVCDLGEVSYAQGTETLIDLEKSKTDLDQTIYQYQQAQDQADEARRDLEAALRLPLNAPLQLSGDYEFVKEHPK